MGLADVLGVSTSSHHSSHSHHHSSHHHRDSSKHRGTSVRSSSHGRPAFVRSASSFFKLANPSSYSVRSSHGGSSYYKRRPRSGYLHSLVRKFKHLLRELWYYARRHPIKIFFLVIMPLISGGVLAGFARQFGIRLPAFLQGRGGGHGMGGLGSSYHSSYSSYGGGGGIDGLTGALGGAGTLDGVMKLAKNFL